MRVIFDTNVLISAFLTTTGPSQHVFALALRRHAVILSPYILEEFLSKLVHKLRFPEAQVKEAVRLLKERTHVLDVPEPHQRAIKFSDKKDIPLLALAEISKAHYFITGDKKLLALKHHGATLFLTPRAAMAVLEND